MEVYVDMYNDVSPYFRFNFNDKYMAQQLMKREAINLKNNKEGYMGGRRGRKGKR